MYPPQGRFIVAGTRGTLIIMYIRIQGYDTMIVYVRTYVQYSTIQYNIIPVG